MTHNISCIETCNCILAAFLLFLLAEEEKENLKKLHEKVHCYSSTLVHFVVLFLYPGNQFGNHSEEPEADLDQTYGAQ